MQLDITRSDTTFTLTLNGKQMAAIIDALGRRSSKNTSDALELDLSEFDSYRELHGPLTDALERKVHTYSPKLLARM